MKIRVAPGRILRLTPTKNTSAKGGDFDLDKLGVPEAEQAEFLELEGVTELEPKKSKPAKKKSGGGSE